MPTYTIRATLSVDVEVALQARDLSAAEDIFLEVVTLGVSLADDSAGRIVERSIFEISDLETCEVR